MEVSPDARPLWGILAFGACSRRTPTALTRRPSVTSVQLRIVCRQHKLVMGRVVYTERGPTYQTRRPLLDYRPILASDEGVAGASLASKRGRRLHEVQEITDVLLSSEEAERYTGDPGYWGTLPAWCKQCREEHWIGLETLRRARGELTV
jgi:hypothetical protein